MYLEYDMYNNGCFDVLFSTSNVLHPILILRSQDRIKKYMGKVKEATEKKEGWFKFVKLKNRICLETFNPK